MYLCYFSQVSSGSARALSGDECLVEWSGEEYTATILVMGDEQEARKAENELLKALDQASDSGNQLPAKKPRLFKKLTNKMTASKPRNKPRQKNI